MAAAAGGAVLGLISLVVLGLWHSSETNAYRPWLEPGVVRLLLPSQDPPGGADPQTSQALQLAEFVLGPPAATTVPLLAPDWFLLHAGDPNAGEVAIAERGALEFFAVDHREEAAAGLGRGEVVGFAALGRGAGELHYVPGDTEDRSGDRVIPVSTQGLGARAGLPSLVSSDLATELGMVGERRAVFLRYPQPPAEEELRRLDLLLSTLGVSARADTGPSAAVSIWFPAVSAAAIGVIVGICAVAAALGLGEGLSTRRLLANIGARPLTQRAIVATQALYAVGYGVLVGAIATMLPLVILFTTTGGAAGYLPWGWIALVALAPAPIVAIASGAVVRLEPPRVPA